MKKLLPLILMSALSAGFLCACGDKDDDVKPVVLPASEFTTGADISWVTEMEDDGKTFKTRAGEKADILDVLKDTGVDAIRLRVWVDPEGGWSGKDDVVALGKRCTAAGLPLMVDFHYSDFFADPGTQTVPAAWKADIGDVTKMAEHVKAHTTEVLTALRKAGVAVTWIQIGNETRNGMIWPLGKLWASGSETVGGWDAFARLYRTGYDAAKAVFPDALVMPHLNNAYSDNDWWFKELKDRGCPFDMIALSHYPQSESKMTWQEYNQTAASRIASLSATYGVKVMVSEIGVQQDTPAVGKEIIADFLARVNRSRCAGVFYWEPEVYGWWKPAIYSKKGWNAYGMGAFTSDGRPSAILEPFLSK